MLKRFHHGRGSINPILVVQIAIEPLPDEFLFIQGAATVINKFKVS
jgi:hypothetical protein